MNEWQHSAPSTHFGVDTVLGLGEIESSVCMNVKSLFTPYLRLFYVIVYSISDGLQFVFDVSPQK